MRNSVANNRVSLKQLVVERFTNIRAEGTCLRFIYTTTCSFYYFNIGYYTRSSFIGLNATVQMPFSFCKILVEHLQLEYCRQVFLQEGRHVYSFYSLSSFVYVWLTPNGFMGCFPCLRWPTIFFPCIILTYVLTLYLLLTRCLHYINLHYLQTYITIQLH